MDEKHNSHSYTNDDSLHFWLSTDYEAGCEFRLRPQARRSALIYLHPSLFSNGIFSIIPAIIHSNIIGSFNIILEQHETTAQKETRS
nr:unnamed protein product [Callosobruchus analis]